MPKFELAKSIDAAPLNPRTLIPTGDPPVTVPYGAIVDHLEQDRDFDKFSYLGKPYRCAHDIFQAAIRKSKAAPAAAPAPASNERRCLEWEELASTHGPARRAKVPGGWLVSVSGDGLAFYPDAEHAWDGASVP
ncbi:MAG TPA: hypothetical protein VHA11_15440 [Bryobacteraceae bacterium]|nr:hypothetical protein [Bryobacteraceae bacterium]